MAKTQPPTSAGPPLERSPPDDLCDRRGAQLGPSGLALPRPHWMMPKQLHVLPLGQPPLGFAAVPQRRPVQQPWLALHD